MPRRLKPASQLAVVEHGNTAVQLRRQPDDSLTAAPASILRNPVVAPQDARIATRQYFGRAIGLGTIEVALRAAWRGNMRPLTDISRETLDTDPHLASVVSKRVDALAGLPYEIRPASGYGVDPAKALFYAAVVREQLANLRNFRKSVKQLAWSLYDGRAALEITWSPVFDGQAMGRFRVTQALHYLAWIHPRRLSFGPLRELRCTDEYVTYGGNFAPYGLILGDPNLAYKFVVWTPQLFGEYPEREGLAPRCLYWSFFKRFGARERMILLELFGKPWRIVTVEEDSQASGNDLLAAEAAADALGSSYTARMPRGVNLDVVQPQKTAGNIHEDVIAESDRQISKLVLGQTGTTDQIKGGFNNQQANVMQDEQLAKLQGDAVELSEVIEDQLTDAIVAMNFGEGELVHAPSFVMRADLPTNRKEEVERLDLALRAGLRVAESEAYAITGFRIPDEGDPYLQVEQPPAQPNSPVAPAPRPVIVYPQGKSPAAGEIQPIPPVAGNDKGSAPNPAASAGAANAGVTVTVNEDRAARGLPPLAKGGQPDPDGELTVAEFQLKRTPKPEPAPFGGGGGEPGGAPKEKPEPVTASVQLTISHEGEHWVVRSEAGKNLGKFKTKAEAEKHLREVEYFKHRDAAASASATLDSELGPSAALDLTMASLAVSAREWAEVEALCPHGVMLAAGDWRQPDTKHGSPDDVVDRGVPEGRRAAAKMAGALDEELAGAKSVTEVYSAINRARHKMDVHPMARALERRLVHAAALGALDASLMGAPVQAAAADDAKGATAFSKTPYAQALRTFKDRKVIGKAAFAKLEAKAKQKAFTVAGLAADEMVATVKDELAKQVAQGADIREFRTAMKARLEDSGWLAKLQTLGDGSRALSASHVDNVFQTNVMGAYNQGRAEQMSQPAVLKARPIWQLRTQGDNLVRENHADNHGMKLYATDSFWQRCYPPMGFRCRCRVVSLPGDQTDGVVDGSSITNLPDEGFTCGLGQ